jgi:uncharacterized protein
MSTLPSEPNFEAKRALLTQELSKLESLAVAFSGGVDSSVLLHAGREALGEHCVGVIADSPSLPREELADARELANVMGAELVVVKTSELEDPRYVANAGDRCYYCKSALFDELVAWCKKRGFAAFAFGEITDDLMDDRPGSKAAAHYGALAPLRDAGFSKADVREYAQRVGLSVAEKPASACLASRLPVGTTVTAERLATIEASESSLRQIGYSVLRVRHHGTRALLEVGELEIERARAELPSIQEQLRPFGFEKVDLGIYVPPSMRPRP